MSEIIESWVVAWFPPYGDKEKTFKSEEAARRFAAREDTYEHEGITQWNPILFHRVKTIDVEETILEL